MWKDAFLAADTPQKGDDSHRIVFWMHSFIKYLYLGCMVLILCNVTSSPEPSVNCHFLEMFTHDKTAKLPVYCLAWYQFKWLHIPVADPGEGPRGPAPHPLIFRPNWGPKGRKSFFSLVGWWSVHSIKTIILKREMLLEFMSCVSVTFIQKTYENKSVSEITQCQAVLMPCLLTVH